MGLQSLLTSTLFSLLCVHILFITESHAQLGYAAVINISPTLPNTAAAPMIDRSFISYSLEHMAMPTFLNSPMLNNLMELWKSKTGSRPGLRIGGSGMDKTTYVPSLDQPVMWTANPSSQYLVGPSYFKLVREYFPSDTQITFGLNLVNTTDNWQNTVEFAVAADESIPQVDLFEIGNEPDLYVSGKQRPRGWTGKDYAEEWKSVANRVKTVLPNAQFQPAVFAGSLKDNFDLSSLVRAGINNYQFKIPTYSLHFYAQSACSGNQNLDRLVDHNILGAQLQRFNPELAAAEAGGARFTMAESNTVSCSGFVDVSDTFASALWLVDYSLAAASKKIERIYFHNGPTTPYSFFIPKGANGLESGIRPIYYGVYFLAEALALPEPGSTTKFMVKPISLPGSPSDIAVYGLYSNRVQRPNLDVAGTTKVAYTTTVLTTKTMVSTDIFETIQSVSTKRIFKSIATSTKSITTTAVFIVPKETVFTKTATLPGTKLTTIENQLLDGSTMTQTVEIAYPMITEIVLPTITRSRTTSQRVYTSWVLSTIWTSQEITLTKIVRRTKPLIYTTSSVYAAPIVVTSTQTTTNPQATNIGNFPSYDGVFLARAVILNLSPYNTSDEKVLNCRSCSAPSPAKYGTVGPRKSTRMTVTGFQPGHRLKLVRLRGPGLNAKAGVNVSGIAFSEETGEVTYTPRPGSIYVEWDGTARFDILASEAVLLVDEKVL
ncbi:hypothetical protein TWF191_010052 [Orbilia oligospora]|uniref:Beta-glucuronidase C-terminal domain-containing protein n=2 Tax=Orbilia oligospora TaxID=2813651 RepID=A0A7C8QHL3_ORBOL|nr:hypothetical protein TWF191_010052 [Orbilia oligospora]